MTANTHSLSLGFVLSDVARLARKRFEQRSRSRSLGLTRAQAAVLAHLSRNEGVNQAALAQILEIEPITLVRLLDRLEAAGFIERRLDPADRRARILYLQPAAHPMLERIRELSREVFEDALIGVAPAARDTLMETLLTMRTNLAVNTAGEPADQAESHRSASRG